MMELRSSVRGLALEIVVLPSGGNVLMALSDKFAMRSDLVIKEITMSREKALVILTRVGVILGVVANLVTVASILLK
jgi:hypothetical protein